MKSWAASVEGATPNASALPETAYNFCSCWRKHLQTCVMNITNDNLWFNLEQCYQLECGLFFERADDDEIMGCAPCGAWNQHIQRMRSSLFAVKDKQLSHFNIVFVCQNNVSRIRNHNSETPLKHATDNSLDDSGESALGKWQFCGTYHWQVNLCWNMQLNIHWKMPLEIHDDFWGVDVWRAICCP